MIVNTVSAVAGSIAAILTLPASVELGMLTVSSLLPERRKAAAKPMGMPERRSIAEKPVWIPRLAVVIPAHNERESIGACLASLARCHRRGVDSTVFVIADNCTDETAAIARAAGIEVPGIEVIERTDTERRGKGHALHYAFSQLLDRFDAFLVIDADTEVQPNLLQEFTRALGSGAEAIQCPYRLLRSESSTLHDLANRAFNVVRPRGRARLGLSAGIFGNGFALSREVLVAVPYTAGSIVEDLEYHLNLVQAGFKIEFLQTTCVRGAAPINRSGRASQRARWEGGRFAMIRQRSGWFARQMLHGRLRYSELLLELFTLPLSFHVLLLSLALALPSTLGRAFALVGFAVLFLHIFAALLAGESIADDLRTLVRTPIYLLWKLCQLPRILKSSGSSAAWVRTARAEEETQRA